MVPPLTKDIKAKVTWRTVLRSRIAFVAIIFLGFLSAGYLVLSRPHTVDGFSQPALMPPPSEFDNLATKTTEAEPTRTRPPNIKYTVVQGIFAQSDESTDPGTFDYRRSSRGSTIFGLNNKDYDTDGEFQGGGNRITSNQQWPRFENYLNITMERAPENIAYKLLLIGRHGEGYHNVAEAQYGTEMWEEYWSRHDNFTDPHLTDTGYMQAQDASALWQSAMKYQHIPTPQSYYVSPLTRCLSTAMLTFSSLELPKWRPFHATVKELLRETLGIHTCDKRSTRTYISTHFNGFDIEPGFTEQDTLWRPDVRETPAEQTQRAKRLLDDVFNTDNSTIVSFTTHSGTIRAMLEVLGHRTWEVAPGMTVPVFVRAEWYEDWELEDGPEPPPGRNVFVDGGFVGGGDEMAKEVDGAPASRDEAAVQYSEDGKMPSLPGAADTGAR